MTSTRAPVTQDAWRPWALRVLLALGLLALLPALPVWTQLQRLEHDLENFKRFVENTQRHVVSHGDASRSRSSRTWK